MINVGISSCLLGEKVRYNGGHTQSRLCLDVLHDYFTFSPFCPEVAAGFGIPRPSMRLIGSPEHPELVFVNKESKDLTPQLIAGFKDKLSTFEVLDGYILMKKSPSCGLERIKVYQKNGHPHKTQVTGLFTQAVQRMYPNLPIEEEGRLHDDTLFDNFITRVYAHHYFRKEVQEQASIGNLMRFHASYKYLLMAHDQSVYRRLGTLVGSHEKGNDLDALIASYFSEFMHCLSIPADRSNHANTLLHILGYLKKTVPSNARIKLVDAIDKYQQGITPLTIPLALLKHYIEQFGSDYIQAQRYLEPYPEDIHPSFKYCVSADKDEN